ncbi:hypothetical protein FRC00_009904 [Tulasnella sp. 408]|nr:hypothetical protein FRC00_009904 [Tulasnella sp. 408]
MEAEIQLTDADVPGPVGPDPNGSSGVFELSAKLRARIENLEEWRIDHSDIEFDEDEVESRGGHATVSRGKMHFKQDVAVKEMRVADDMDFERVLALAIREAEFLADLDHRNIVKLRGFVEDISKSIIWLVFPWAERGNLRDYIASENWEIPVKILLKTQLNVLVYLGRHEVIYATITDFGSARRLPQQGPDINTMLESQLLPVNSPCARFNTSTKTITLTGNNYTLRWAAPELLLEDQLSLWSDIWALGWIAYEERLFGLNIISN